MKAEEADANKDSAEGDAAEEASQPLSSFLEQGTRAIAGNTVLASITVNSTESSNAQLSKPLLPSSMQPCALQPAPTASLERLEAQQDRESRDVGIC